MRWMVVLGVVVAGCGGDPCANIADTERSVCSSGPEPECDLDERWPGESVCPEGRTPACMNGGLCFSSENHVYCDRPDWRGGRVTFFRGNSISTDTMCAAVCASDEDYAALAMMRDDCM